LYPDAEEVLERREEPPARGWEERLRRLRGWLVGRRRGPEEEEGGG